MGIPGIRIVLVLWATLLGLLLTQNPNARAIDVRVGAELVTTGERGLLQLREIIRDLRANPDRFALSSEAAEATAQKLEEAIAQGDFLEGRARKSLAAAELAYRMDAADIGDALKAHANKLISFAQDGSETTHRACSEELRELYLKGKQLAFRLNGALCSSNGAGLRVASFGCPFRLAETNALADRFLVLAEQWENESQQRPEFDLQSEERRKGYFAEYKAITNAYTELIDSSRARSRRDSAGPTSQEID
jgi:hypothetical protein